MLRWLTALCVFIAACGAPPEGDRVVSLLGTTLAPTPVPKDARRAHERAIVDAKARLARDPNDADARIWLGRRTAYLGRYREAIAIFGEGLARHPNDARFLRHRGHRFITIRRFDDAARDLTCAADMVRDRPDTIEPDGLPNARGVPTTTLHSNIHYHLGLAHYLRGDFASALPAFEACARATSNDDHLVSTSYWRYLTLRRLGRHDEAAALLAEVPADLTLLENHAYHRLLLAFQGKTAPTQASGRPALDDATYGYGMGAFHLVEGRRDEARTLFESTARKSMWAAFGVIAAEAELARGR